VTSQLDSSGTWLVDAGNEVFVWVGASAPSADKGLAVPRAVRFLVDGGRPATAPVTRVVEGQVNHVFGALVRPG